MRFTLCAPAKVAGYTLIEVMMYSALVTVVVGVAVLSSLTFVNAGARNSYRAEVLVNERFVRSKMNWLMQGVTNSEVTAPVTTSDYVEVAKSDGTRFRLRLNGTALELVRDTNSDNQITNADTAIPLTNRHVTVSSAAFTRETWNGQATLMLSITFERGNYQTKLEKRMYLL